MTASMAHPARPARFLAAVLIVACLPLGARGQAEDRPSLRQIVPQEAQIAMAWRYTPEQHVLWDRLSAVADTIREEKIAERVLAIIRARVGPDDLDQASQAIERIRQAVAPAPLDALLHASEAAYFEVAEGEAASLVVAVRMTPDAVRGYVEAARNLLVLLKEESGEDFSIAEEQVDGASYLTLYPPGVVPLQPTIVGKDDVLLFSTTQPLARAAVLRLNAPGVESKFDEPRVRRVLDQLHGDAYMTTVVDGKLTSRGIQEQIAPAMATIEQLAEENPSAKHVRRLLEAFLEEIAVMDLEVAVAYVDGGDFHTESLGLMLPGTDERLLRRVVVGGPALDNWRRWAPANAHGFRISSGVDPHALYSRAMEIFSREAPDLAAEALQHLTAFEEQAGLRLEHDLLALFSGELASVALEGGQSVLAMKCHRPDRALELIHRAVAAAQQAPQLEQQRLELVACDELPGFEELRATFLAALGARPVVGVREGWLLIGSTPAAARQVMDVRWGEAADFTSTEAFKRLSVEPDAPVRAVSYSSTADTIHSVSRYINQAAAMAPLLLGAAMADAPPADAETAQQVIGLLPSVARVVDELDFFQATLSVQQPGPTHDSYRERRVVVIQQD